MVAGCWSECRCTSPPLTCSPSSSPPSPPPGRQVGTINFIFTTFTSTSSSGTVYGKSSLNQPHLHHHHLHQLLRYMYGQSSLNQQEPKALTDDNLKDRVINLDIILKQAVNLCLSVGSCPSAVCHYRSNLSRYAICHVS